MQQPPSTRRPLRPSRRGTVTKSTKFWLRRCDGWRGERRAGVGKRAGVAVATAGAGGSSDSGRGLGVLLDQHALIWR